MVSVRMRNGGAHIDPSPPTDDDHTTMWLPVPSSTKNSGAQALRAPDTSPMTGTSRGSDQFSRSSEAAWTIEVDAQPLVASKWKPPSAPVRMKGSRIDDTSPRDVSTGFTARSDCQRRPSTLAAKYTDSSVSMKYDITYTVRCAPGVPGRWRQLSYRV